MSNLEEDDLHERIFELEATIERLTKELDAYAKSCKEWEKRARYWEEETKVARAALSEPQRRSTT